MADVGKLWLLLELLQKRCCYRSKPAVLPRFIRLTANVSIVRVLPLCNMLEVMKPSSCPYP